MSGPREGQRNSFPVDSNPGREAPRSKLINSTSTDLLVCFPSRTRLPLMSKRVCSPARPLTDPSDPLRRRRGPQLGRSYSMVGLGRASPLVRSKGERHAPEIAEPTSPRVTCSGQIRVQPSTTATTCRILRPDVEEIERINNGRTKQSRKKSLGWLVDSDRSNKDTMLQPSACSRRSWLDFRCFGSFPVSRKTGDGRGYENCQNGKADAMGTVFARWFMVLQQDDHETNRNGSVGDKDMNSVVDAPPSDPPPGNLLLRMRRRSTPIKCWSEATECDQDDYEGGSEGGIEEEKDRGEQTIQKIKEDLVTTIFDSALLSGVLPEKAHAINGLRPDPLTRSKSWKT